MNLQIPPSILFDAALGRTSLSGAPRSTAPPGDVKAAWGSPFPGREALEGGSPPMSWTAVVWSMNAGVQR
jgi:hypothetical protein